MRHIYNAEWAGMTDEQRIAWVREQAPLLSVNPDAVLKRANGKTEDLRQHLYAVADNVSRFLAD